MQGYEEKDPRGMPFSLSMLGLPLCLHKNSREVIAASSRSYLLKIMEKYPQVHVGFADRTTAMLPYAFEGFGLLMERGCISIADDGRLRTSPDKVRRSVTGTDETKSCHKLQTPLKVGILLPCLSNKPIDSHSDQNAFILGNCPMTMVPYELNLS